MRETGVFPTARAGEEVRIRILIADRSAHYRETVRRVVGRYGNCKVVGEASSLPEAVSKARGENPDVVLLEFDLVAHEKADRLRRLSRSFSHLKVIIMLTDDSWDYRQAVHDRWGYESAAKDRVEEHLAWILGDVKSVSS
jgi:chemotaxis response regulator CheB